MHAEKEITTGIRKGDIQQFEILFRSSYATLVRYATSVIKDPDTAEEIVQELFYRLWKDREKILINTSLEGYLYRSVHNMCLHHLYHRKVVDRHNTEMGKDGNNVTTGPAEELYHKELLDRVAVILEKLPERCGRIFYLNRFEGLKYSEIARKLSISEKTVEANMGKALKEFRKALAEQR